MTLSLQQYLDSDATELALMVQRGEISAAELLDQYNGQALARSYLSM